MSDSALQVPLSFCPRCAGKLVKRWLGDSHRGATIRYFCKKCKVTARTYTPSWRLETSPKKAQEAHKALYNRGTSSRVRDKKDA